MTDLIRRMDAIQACQVGPSDEWARATKDGYNQAATDCQRNILLIEPAPNTGAVKVKPLAWKKRAYETHVSNAYRVGRSYGQGPEPFMVSHGSEIIGWSDSEDGCKRIADHHNRVLILAAIEPTPDPRDAVIARLEAEILKAAGEEYILEHVMETDWHRMGRHSTVRGMMVRLGLYPKLEGAIDAALAATKEVMK